MLRIQIQVLVYPVRLLDKEWEYLMLKRIKNRGGFWQGVTGALEGNENNIQGAKRELLEETGYVVNTLIETDLSFKIPMKDRWKEVYPTGIKELIEYVLIAKIDNLDRPKIDPIEHNDWKWCNFEEAMDLLHLDSNKTALEYVKHFLEEE